MNSLKKQAIKGVQWTTISTITITIISIIKISILTRYIGKADFGLFAIATFIINFMGLFIDLGISSAIIYKQNITKEQYSSLYWLNILFSLIIYLFILSITPLVSSFYKLNQLSVLIPIATSSLIISAIGRQSRVVLQKNLNFKKISIFDIVANVAGLIVSTCLAYFNYGVYALVYSAIVTAIVSSTLYLFDGLNSNRISFRFKFNETKPFFKIGLYQTGGQIINYFNRDIDILIIGKLYSPEILGSYSLAKQLVFRPMQFINPVINSVVAPLLAKVQNEPNRLKSIYMKIVSLVSTVNFSVYLLIAIFAKLIVIILYGNQYVGITTLVQLLSVYVFVRSLLNPVGSLLTATGKTKLDFNWNLLILFLVPLSVFFGTLISVNAVALSLSFLSFLLIVPSWYFLIRKLIKINLIEYIFSLLPRYKQALLIFSKKE